LLILHDISLDDNPRPAHGLASMDEPGGASGRNLLESGTLKMTGWHLFEWCVPSPHRSPDPSGRMIQTEHRLNTTATRRTNTG